MKESLNLPDHILSPLLIIIEQNTDLPHTTFMDRPIWPVLRSRLAFFLRNNKFTNSDDFSQFRKIERQIAERLVEVTAKSVTLKTRKESIKRHNRNRKKSSLFFHRGTDPHVKTEHGRWSVIVDPWFEASTKRGTAVKLDIASNEGNAPPRAFEPVLMPPPTVPSTRLDERHWRELRDALTQVADFLKSDFDVEVDTEGVRPEIFRNLKTAFYEAQHFESYIQKYDPSFVYISCSYCPSSFGSIWASREHGAKIIEICHGRTNKNHIVYTHQTRLTKDNSFFMPDTIMAWGQNTKDSMIYWPNITNSYFPEVIVSGRPDLYNKNYISFNSAQDGWAQEIREQYEKIILVTLGTEPELGFTQFLIRAIRAAPDNWYWLIRCHSAHTRDFIYARFGPETQIIWSEDIAELVNKLGLENVDVLNATTAPLHLLLDFTDRHVTFISSTIIEALTAGVPSVCIHKWAATHYWREEIEAGIVDYTDNVDGLLQFIADPTKSVDGDAVARRVANRDPSAVLDEIETGVE